MNFIELHIECYEGDVEKLRDLGIDVDDDKTEFRSCLINLDNVGPIFPLKHSKSNVVIEIHDTNYGFLETYETIKELIINKEK